MEVLSSCDRDCIAHKDKLYTIWLFVGSYRPFAQKVFIWSTQKILCIYAVYCLYPKKTTLTILKLHFNF